MSRLALYMFGPPRVELEGEAVHIGRRKAVALLAYLAVMPGAHSRDSLAALLWPDYDQRSARTDLSRTLSVLSNLLGAGWFHADRESIGLDAEQTPWLDVAVFRQRLASCEGHGHAFGLACPECQARLTEAAKLYRDNFLAGFNLPDSLPFDEWVRYQTVNLRDELGSVLERLSACCAAQGEFERAIAVTQRWLALDPLREAAHRCLMERHAQAGQIGAALRQYRTCLRVLEQELDVPPAAETTELYERMRAERLESAEKPVFVATPIDRAAALPAFLRPVQDAVHEDAAGPARIAQPVFVAREAELAWLDDCLEAALQGQGKAVFVTGGPGRGKSALLRAFTGRALAAHPDLLAAGGYCSAYAGAGDPYLPFREVMGMLTGDVEARWAAGIISRDHAQRLWAALPLMVPALLDHGPHLIETFVPGKALLARMQTLRDSESLRVSELQEWVALRHSAGVSPHQSRIIQQFADTLQALAVEHPMLLTLDDLHWVDNASASLLFNLGRQLARGRGRVLILGAYRPEEVTLDSDGERHPLRKVLREFERCFGQVRLDLAAADEVRGGAFVDAYLDSEPNQLGEDFRSELCERTGGHALFTTELLRAMQERGELVQTAQGAWVTGTDLNWERLPVRVGAVIQERIERLDESARDLLAVASIEGEVFTAQAVAQVQGLSERDVLRMLSRELGSRGQRLVREAREVTVGRRCFSRFEFSHALFQEYVYKTLSVSERRLFHSEIGVALEGLYAGRTDEIAPALARHFQTGGQSEKAAAYALRAGELATNTCAFFEAIKHLRSALGLYRELGNRPGEAEVLRAMYSVHFYLGSPSEEAEGYRREALRLYRELEHWEEEAWILRFSGYQFIVQGDVERAESSFEQVAAIFRESGELRRLAWTLQGLARLYHECTGDFERSRACAEEGIRLGQELDDRETEAANGFEFGAALHFEGDYTGADPYLKQGIQVFQEHGRLLHVAGCLIHVGLNAIALGDYAAARAHLEQSHSIYRRFGLEERYADSARTEAALALLYHQLGDNNTAQDHAQWAVDISHETGYRSCRATALTRLGHAQAALGELAIADDTYQEALALRREIGQRHLAPEPLAGLARVALAQDDPAAALAYVEEILSHLETGSVNGTDEPLRIYATCYRVLRANGDPRAAEILYTAYALLQERAAKITDEALHRSYLENVAVNRELVREFQAEGRDRSTRS